MISSVKVKSYWNAYANDIVPNTKQEKEIFFKNLTNHLNDVATKILKNASELTSHCGRLYIKQYDISQAVHPLNITICESCQKNSSGSYVCNAMSKPLQAEMTGGGNTESYSLCGDQDITQCGTSLASCLSGGRRLSKSLRKKQRGGINCNSPYENYCGGPKEIGQCCNQTGGGRRLSKSLRKKQRGGINCNSPYENYCGGPKEIGQCCNQTGGGRRLSKSLRKKQQGGGCCSTYCGYCDNSCSQCGGGCYQNKLFNKNLKCACECHYTGKRYGGVLPNLEYTYNLKLRKISIQTLHQCITFYMNQLMNKLRNKNANTENVIKIFKNIV
jgi:hypothetical protein